MRKYRLHNLDCADCAYRVERALADLDSVDSVSVNFSTATMHIDTERMDEVIETIRSVEPDIQVFPAEGSEENPRRHTRLRLSRELLTIISSVVIFSIGLFLRERLTPSSFAEYGIFLTVYLLSGWRVLYLAGRKLFQGNLFDEHFLMSVATLGAIAIHALPEAAGVMIFYKIGSYLENLAVDRSRRSVKSLLEIRPDSANLKEAGDFRKVDPKTVRTGDIVLVKPGERVPLDGKVLSGESYVDTSALTGEPTPRRVERGDTLLSGMIVTTGSLEVKVTRRYEDSSASRILELVEHALQNKASTEKFISTFARYYTPAVVVIALLVALVPPLVLTGATFSDWIYRALVMLVISCPCALVISIPLSYFASIGSASRRGILVKGSSYIDTMTAVKAVVFDKTGTLTRGVFKVTGIHSSNGFTEHEILKHAAIAESHSNHPIGQAIRAAYSGEIDPGAVQDYHELPGQGLTALVHGRAVVVGNDSILHREGIDHERCSVSHTVSHVALDGTYAGYLVIGDEMKSDAAGAIGELKKLGIRKTVMLTGDSEPVSRALGTQLRIDEVHAGLLPRDKVRILEDILAEAGAGEKVAFVGDGLNDAPVIARADVGIAMGKLGSDASIDVADVVLMTDSLTKLPELLRLSRGTRRIVYENIVLALLVKLAFVVLATFGMAGMWEAVFADMGVALLAILNALRVLRLTEAASHLNPTAT
jgi:Cd2+/Zn2+-exporting ATPase